jgi:tetratricopeptide (TPR) repeat protein
VSKPRPSPLGAVLRFLRFASGLNEAEAAGILGMRAPMLSELERGEEGTLSRDRLEELLALLGIPTEAIDPALYALDIAFPSVPMGSPVDPTPAERRSIHRAAVDAGRAALEATWERLTANLRLARAARARRQAGSLWSTLEVLSGRRWRAAVDTERRYWTWALAERLCEESVRAAAHRADEAVELARLAVRVAELAPGSETWRSRLLGFVWPFVANARRVQGDLPGAEEAFSRADRLWEAGAPADPGLLDGTRRLDLKASLRSYQGQFDEALLLLDQALQATGSAEARGRLLIQKATNLKLKGEHEPAIAILRQAEALIAGSRDPRLSWMVRFTLATNLNQLGRHGEAKALLPGVRKLAVELANELDLIRVLWLDAEIATGLRRREEAISALEQVRRYFTTAEIAYDAALASLELAILYLEEGRTAEVGRLAEEMFWIFKAQGVHQEALAAIRLFCEAVKREEVTAEMARHIVDYLGKARHRPELRFEGRGETVA